MIILLPAAILILFALVLLMVRFFVPESRYYWLVAVFGSLLGLIGVFVWQTQISLVREFSIWRSTSVFSQSPTFHADGIAWPFAVSLLALNAAIIITAVVRSNVPIPFNFVGTLVLTSLGVLAVSADNPLTLVMIWAAIDLVELITQLRFVEDPKLSERVVIAFASRAAGSLILLWADMISAANGQVLDFHSASTVSAQAG